MKRQLYRSQKNRMIGGVAGGIAEYFDIDPVIVRALFIISLLGWGMSLIAYIVLWIIVPDESKIITETAFSSVGKVEVDEKFRENYTEDSVEWNKERIIEKKEKRSEARKILGGVILIVFGIVLLLDNILQYSVFEQFWPLVLIIFGIFILMRSKNLNNSFNNQNH